MSRKGKVPIPLPKGVEVKIERNAISIKGPKGLLIRNLTSDLQVVVQDQQIIVSPASTEGGKEVSALHGLYWSLIANMVKGVTEGFEKKLEMVGVGYRAAVQGKILDLQIGTSHPNKVEIPEGITVSVDKSTMIFIKGIDKQKVGQFAADVRAKRPPEPYKGKGIRMFGEYVRHKAGKAGKKQQA